MKPIKIGKNVVEEDIELILPNGEKIVIQYRAYEEDGCTIDICLESNANVINWSDDDMTPALPDPQIPEVMQNVKQLSFSFPSKRDDE